MLYLGAEAGWDVVREVLDRSVQIIHTVPEPSTVARLLGEATGVLDASMKVPITRDMLNAAPRLRIISCATTGSDHIDGAAAEERGIEVCTLRENPDVLRNLTPAAELSWALLLACARRLPAAVGHVTEGSWDRESFPGVMLNGKTLGLVGCGRIGGWMARYGQAFGMTVIAHDPYIDKAPVGVQLMPLEEVAARADFISVHVHLGSQTRNLVSAEVFACMKPGCIFVNTSRSGLVDERALLEGLESGRLAAAGLDVLGGEPNIASNPLLGYARTNDNLLITPHCGGFSPDAVRIVCGVAAEKITRVLEAVL